MLSLYASAKTTGLVVDSGHSFTHVVPIYEGYLIPHGVISMSLAGDGLSRVLHDTL